MWEWFLPAAERDQYYSQIMEGSGGGGGPLEPQVIGWLWGFLFGAAFAAGGLFVLWLALL